MNMRTFSIVKLYAYEDLYPSTKVVPREDNAESKCVQGEFFTPSTKKVLDDLSQEIVQPSEQDQTTGLKRSLFPDDANCPGASAALLKASTAAVVTKGADSSVIPMEVTCPVKKNKNKEKTV